MNTHWKAIWQGEVPCPDCGVKTDEEHQEKCPEGIATLIDIAHDRYDEGEYETGKP